MYRAAHGPTIHDLETKLSSYINDYRNEQFRKANFVSDIYNNSNGPRVNIPVGWIGQETARIQINSRGTLKEELVNNIRYYRFFYKYSDNMSDELRKYIVKAFKREFCMSINIDVVCRQSTGDYVPSILVQQDFFNFDYSPPSYTRNIGGGNSGSRGGNDDDDYYPTINSLLKTLGRITVSIICYAFAVRLYQCYQGDCLFDYSGFIEKYFTHDSEL